jgi:hypothetical protein
MRKIEVVEVCSRNNEIHLIMQEHENDWRLRVHGSFSRTEVKDIMKKEAAKPLLLLRAE